MPGATRRLPAPWWRTRKAPTVTAWSDRIGPTAAEQRWREVMLWMFVRLLTPLAFFTGALGGAIVMIAGPQSYRPILVGLVIAYFCVTVLVLTLWTRARRRSRALASEHLTQLSARHVFVPIGTLKSFVRFDSWRAQNGIVTSPPPTLRAAPRAPAAGVDPLRPSTMGDVRAVDPDAAAAWARASLSQGSAVSSALVRRLEEMDAAAVLTREQFTDSTLDNRSRGLSAGESDQTASEVLIAMASTGVTTLIVEDEFARTSDSGLIGDLAFVEDRVLRWAALSASDDAGIRLLHVSSGFPLNAFVCRGTPEELGLSRRGLVDEHVRNVVVDAVVAILVSVYDGESYLLLTSSAPREIERGRDGGARASREVAWLRALIRYAGDAHDRDGLGVASLRWLPTAEAELDLPLCTLIELCEDRSARSVDIDGAIGEILTLRGHSAPSASQWRWAFALSAVRGHQELDTTQRHHLLTALAREATPEMVLLGGLIADEDAVEEGLLTPSEFDESVARLWADVRLQLSSRALSHLGADSWLVRHA
ncbi:hypothetical protein [Microbacterium panaciterrae]|uniref:Uncharacterized protein n=1 Tax=Microbacterium panaciterrae TaxID=985759 RepID=A0ABP8PQ29_9MICO